MGEETSESENSEKEEEILSEYEISQEETQKIIEEEHKMEYKKPNEKPNEKTKVVRDKKIKGLDYCPYCDSEKLGKDRKKNIYICLDCGQAYQIVES